MATQTRTKASTSPKEETKPTVTASTKLVADIQSYVKSASETLSRFLSMGQTARAEADKQGLDRSQALVMVRLSYRQAMGFAKGSEKEIAAGDKKYFPDVSKVVSLAFPATPAAERELKKAVSHNESGKGSRIGVNNLLKLSRYNPEEGKGSTFAEVLETKATAKATKGKAKYTMTALKNDIGGIFSRARKAGHSWEKIDAAIEGLRDEWDEKEADAEAKEKNAGDEE